MNHRAKYISILLCTAAAVGALWLAVKFLLPWASPFILAFAAAALLEPMIKRMCLHGWRRSIASGVLSLALLGIIATAAWAFTSRGISLASDFAKRVPELVSSVGDGLSSLELRILRYIENAPEAVGEYMQMALEAAGDVIYKLPGSLSQWALDLIAKAAQNSPDIFLFIVTAGIGTYFLSASFPRICAFIYAQMPSSLKEKLSVLTNSMRSGMGGWLRAQLILIAITFFELLIAFMLLGIKGALGIAAITAVIDALPVFGTGFVLVPWALYSLLSGNTWRGLGLIICWAIVNIVRSCTQAKLLGDQIGLDPVASLAAIYIGWQVMGVWGMLLFPILFVTLKQLNSSGIIKLWKEI